MIAVPALFVQENSNAAVAVLVDSDTTMLIRQDWHTYLRTWLDLGKALTRHIVTEAAEVVGRIDWAC